MSDTTNPNLPQDVRGLLAAICAAADVPLPGITTADEAAHHRLLTTRMSDIRILVQGVLKGHDPARAAALLREDTARHPVTYTRWHGAPEGGVSGE